MVNEGRAHGSTRAVADWPFADLLAPDQAVSRLFSLILGLAVSSVGKVDEASVSLQVAPEQIITSNATSETIRVLDRLQYDEHQGPCVEAIDTGEQVLLCIPDGKWADFEARAADAGLRSVWSLPLRWGDRSLGALNLYSRSPDAWGDPRAVTLADQATTVLATFLTVFETQRVNENLRIALASRDVIGQAKGVLMARQGISAEEAFALLRRASQRSNRKLRDIAQDVVDRARPA